MNAARVPSDEPKPDEPKFDKPSSDRLESARKPCPICGKTAVEATAPFCSKRCANVDLHRWLGGVYVVPDDGPDQPVSPEEDEG